MQTLNTAELAFLSILGNEELTRKALKLYAGQVYLFTDMFCPHLNLMWNAYVALLGQYRKEFGLKLRGDIVAAGLSEAVAADRNLPPELRDRCDAVLQKLASGDLPDTSEGTALIGRLVKLDGNRKLMAKINANADLQALQQSLDASRRVLGDLSDNASAAADGSLDMVFSPFRDIRKLATRQVRVPTGINWLDDLSSGGGREGDKWLILGTSGGGKSVCAVQYACAQALMGNDTLWVTYEQSIEGDLAERMIANITDTSLSRIRDLGFDNLPEEVREKFLTAVAGVDDRLVALDMTRWQKDPTDPEDNCGIASVRKQFLRLKEQGHRPKTVILDWFGSMMAHIAANEGLDLASCYRFKAQEEIDKLVAFAKEEKVLVIVFHQLDTAANEARPTSIPGANQAQDMKSLQNYFDLVLTIGKRDENEVCYFANPKNRKGQRIVRTLRLIGDKARFVMEDGWLPDSRTGSFYRPMDGGQDDGGGKAAASGYSREVM